MSQKTKGSRAHSLDSPTARRVGGAAASKSSLCGKNPPKRPEIGKVASGTKKGLPYSHKSKHTDLPLTQPASAMHSVSSPVGTGHDGLSKSAAVAKLERELAVCFLPVLRILFSVAYFGSTVGPEEGKCISQERTHRSQVQY